MSNGRAGIDGEKGVQAVTLAIGPLRLRGRSGQIASYLILAAIVALIVYYRARILSTPLTISALLWIAFVVYWNAAPASSARTVRKESAGSRAVHQNLLMLALLLLFAPLPWLDWRVLPAGTYWVVVGLTLQAASLGLAIAARRTLGRYWSGEITQKQDHELIQSGPYRFVRHPIYSAMLGMSVGTALVSADAHAFLGAVIMAGAYVRKIRLEEGNLAEVFGARYEEYRRTTRALIPWIF